MGDKNENLLAEYLQTEKVLWPEPLPDDVQRRHTAFLAAATSENTRNAYQAAIRHFLGWGGKLPADESAMIHYLVSFSGKLSSRTLALRLTALSQWHRYQGFADPCKSPEVRKLLAGIARVHAKPQKKAYPLSTSELQQIVSFLGRQEGLKPLRDSAIVQLGFYGGFRRSELAAMQLSWLTWSPQGVVIEMPRSKTDQSGQGIVKAIPYSGVSECPVLALKHWVAEAGIGDGYVFRAINQWGQLAQNGLNPASINLILSSAAEMAGVQVFGRLSSHSLRRGMATSAYRAGAEFRDIKRQGGWRHDGTVQGYIDDAGLFEENAVRVLYKSASR